MRFTQAIVRTPCPSFADGLTTAGLGKPDVALALAQHAAYVEALRECGLEVTVLPPDEAYPDSTFVEDTAVLTADWALVTRPGAASRAGEAESMARVLASRFDGLGAITAPGTLDGGDICEAFARHTKKARDIGPSGHGERPGGAPSEEGSPFFLGVSDRTNELGAQQLAAFLSARGHASTLVDIRQTPGLLHLKSGIASIAPNTLVVVESLANHPAFSEYYLIPVTPEETYAANCLRLNDRVLLASGFPKLEASLRAAGFSLLVLDMSEFRKMDGGLSCLSLRY